MTNKKDFINARLQLHQASQLLAALGISFLEKKDDDSHTNMQWNNNFQSLFSHSFGPQDKLRLALSFPQFKYRIYDDDLLSEFDCDGKTENQAVNWLKETLKKKGVDISAFTTDRHYQIPDNPQAKDENYDLFDENVFTMISYHFSLAYNVLSQIVQEHDEASPIRCWPHHFDLATLITVASNPDPEKMKSVGIGLSPGDENYDRPYFYVSPWPYPEKSNLNNADLPSDGFWHSEGFTSAILLADNYLTYEDIEASVFNFISKAVQISMKMITQT